MENKISVVINTYNARRHLAQVLESVKDFDEIVVCDMESTDDTREIAEKYGCKIVIFPKAHHTCCEPARTFAESSSPTVLPATTFLAKTSLWECSSATSILNIFCD